MNHAHCGPKRQAQNFLSYARMTWIEHLEELRLRVIYVVIAFVIAFLFSFAFVYRLYHYFVAPLEAEHLRLIVVSPGEIVTVFLAISGFAAIGLSLPFAIWQLWLFVSPGLMTKERSYTLRLIPFVSVMFVAGLCFAWFLVFPTVLHFLIRLTEQQGLGMFLRAGAYFSFLTSIVLPFGFVFELPVMVVFLTRVGIITPQLLRKTRRYAYLVIVIFGVLISPPELISHLSVTLPMVLLYEISILLSTFVSLRNIRNQQAM